MKIKSKKRFFITTIIIFIILIIGDRYIGIKGIANLYPTYTYSWIEISNNILFYLCWTLFISIPLNYGFEWAKNADKKNIENAKKRIEEREKQEKEQKTMNSENIKEDDDKNEKNNNPI